MQLPIDKQEVIDNVLADLRDVKGVIAIVLGGSYAMGTAKENSDVDLGIYYSEKDPFDIDHIKTIAGKYAVVEPTVTGFYGWGPWVNGGAWIQTSAGKVDLLYRNLEQVERTIENAHNGIWQNDFEQQPPYGFSSIIYLAETNICVSLFDPAARVARLKESVKKYPIKLRQAVIRQSLWAAEFTIWQAEYFFSKSDDIYNTAGCVTRAVKNIITALFAVNDIYPLGDKRAIAILEKAAQRPLDLKKKVDEILVLNRISLNENIDLLKKLFNETVGIAKENYQPFFDLSRAENG